MIFVRYIMGHLTGQHSLRRAFGINTTGVFITGLLIVMICIFIGAKLDDVPRLILGLGRDALLLILGA
jgi:hypothetical protein